jgi:antitoxin VapB
MSLLIDDPETVAAIEALADSKKLSVADAVKDAITNEQLRVAQHAERRARMKALGDKIAQYPPTGLKADKVFFDELGGNL